MNSDTVLNACGRAADGWVGGGATPSPAGVGWGGGAGGAAATRREECFPATGPQSHRAHGMNAPFWVTPHSDLTSTDLLGSDTHDFRRFMFRLNQAPWLGVLRNMLS